MGEFICRKCGKPATKIYLKDEHWQNECDECFGGGKMSNFEEEWGWAPDYEFEVVGTNDPDGKIARRQGKRALKQFKKKLKKLLREARK